MAEQEPEVPMTSWWRITGPALLVLVALGLLILYGK